MSTPPARRTGFLPRRLTATLGAAGLLLAGFIAPTSVTVAQAGPGIQPRNGAPPMTTYAVIRLIGVGDNPIGVAIDDSDDTVYVTNTANPPTAGTVSVINGRTGVVVGAPIGVGTKPIGIAVNHDDDTVYVTNYGSNTVSLINGRTAFVVGAPIGVGTNPSAVAVDQNDDTVYVTNLGSNNLSVINGRTGNVVGATIGVGSRPDGVAVNHDDDTVYVTNFFSNNVSVINGRTSTQASIITVGNRPSAVAVDQRNDTVYVTNSLSNTVSVINGLTGTLTDDTITVGAGPSGVAVDDTGTNQGLVYITNQDDSNVSVIGRASPTLATTSGDSGSVVTVNVDVPQVAYDVDDSTVTSVSFGGMTASGLAAAAGDQWTVDAPAGTPGSSVAVTVTFRGGLTAAAGTFTYNASPPPPPPVFPPSAPVNVTAVAGDAQATVTWTAPASSGSFPITTYEVRSSPAGDTCLVSVLTCTITDLTNGTAYTFEARALNGAGWGPWSTPSNTVTPAAPPPPPPAVTISITGSRGTGADRQIVFVTGTSTGLSGDQVRAHVKLRGQADYRPGRFISVSAEGRFDWQRTTGKKTYVYMTGGGVQSNRVIIPAVRR